ncbi:MAG: hypothetical protein ACQESF_00680 [Nanobdellota archaeon]
MNKKLVFDTGPIITLTLNNLLWIIEPLKEHLKGEFYICPAVFEELIKKPLTTKKYKFEALQVLPYIYNKTIELKKEENCKKKTEEMLELANNCFSGKGNPIKIVHKGEIEAIATALETGAQTLVIDERTTRILIENPYSLSEHLSRKLHTNIEINRENLDKLTKEIKHLKVIRSFELGVASYELGILENYMLKKDEELEEVDNVDYSVLEGVLWAIKLSGCSVTREDIEQVLELEKKRTTY